LTIGSDWSGEPPPRVLCALLGGDGRAIGAAGLVHAKSGDCGSLVRFIESNRTGAGAFEVYELNLSASDVPAMQVQGIAVFIGPAQPQGVSRVVRGFSDAGFTVGMSHEKATSHESNAAVSFRASSRVSSENACVVRAFDLYRHQGKWKVKVIPRGHEKGWAEVLSGLGFQPSGFTSGL